MAHGAREPNPMGDSFGSLSSGTLARRTQKCSMGAVAEAAQELCVCEPKEGFAWETG